MGCVCASNRQVRKLLEQEAIKANVSVNSLLEEYEAVRENDEHIDILCVLSGPRKIGEWGLPSSC